MMSTMRIADLHCDLLHYLAIDEGHTPYDAAVRCSIPQLTEGDVALQVVAIFTETERGSSRCGAKQIAAYHSLVHQNITFLPAIENASSLIEEDEELSFFFARLQNMDAPVYISMTWNTENRFGGGAHTNIGIKSDGVFLLEWMSGKQIAVDLSHASDSLAYDILNTIDKRQLEVPVIASHSNCRAVKDVARNLPDELIREVISRKGVIGLNFFKEFLGDTSEAFSAHLQHFLGLGAEHTLCFGADFFCEESLPLSHRRDSYYFSGYDNSSCYPRIIQQWRSLGIDKAALENICSRNLLNFLKSSYASSAA